MKAAQISQYGDASQIKLNEVDKPAVEPGKVLVEVYSASINPVDTAIREGHMHDNAPLNFPATLGGDFAGVVAELGSGVDGFAVGDKVYGQSNAAFGNGGTFAEYTLTAAGQLAKAPSSLSFNESASLPLVGASALQALTEGLDLRSGQKILITGGSGGIGSIAIQIAKSIGAVITTTTTGDGIELVKHLGADEVSDYKIQKIEDLPKDFDAVYDTVGGEGFNQTLRLLKSGGKAVSMIAQPDAALAAELGVAASMQLTHVTTDVLGKLSQLVDAGTVKPQVGKVFKLDQIVEAFKAKESNTVPGKIAIEIKPE